jgi:mannose-6-phosphate isomerase class I
VACDKFVLERWTFAEPRTLATGGRPRIVAVLSGGVRIQGDPSERPLSAGETALIPAACESLMLEPLAPTVLLCAGLP